jgi:hypothetical protein
MNSNIAYFVIAGGQRCGTTFLYHLLNEHPGIQMNFPSKPEPKFYINEEEFIKGRDYYLFKYFTNALDNPAVKAIGEKSTSYIEYPFVPQRIKSTIPGAKILMILRNPTDRAISNYSFSVKNGLEKRSLSEVFLTKYEVPEAPIGISVNPFRYLERGNYSFLISPFIESFQSDFKVLILEELINDKEIQNNLFKFLGVEPIEINADKLPKNSADNILLDPIDLAKVKNKLDDYYKTMIGELELLLNREIGVWKK